MSVSLCLFLFLSGRFQASTNTSTSTKTKTDTNTNALIRAERSPSNWAEAKVQYSARRWVGQAQAQRNGLRHTGARYVGGGASQDGATRALRRAVLAAYCCYCYCYCSCSSSDSRSASAHAHASHAKLPPVDRRVVGWICMDWCVLMPCRCIYSFALCCAVKRKSSIYYHPHPRISGSQTQVGPTNLAQTHRGLASRTCCTIDIPCHAKLGS